MKRLLLLAPMLIVSPWFPNQPAKTEDLGVAEMREVAPQQDGPPIFQGRCGGPLSDTVKKCRIVFVNGQLVVSRKTEVSEKPENDFNETRVITSD